MDKFIMLDKHLNPIGELDYTLVDSPLVIQDATTGEDTLHFAYPVDVDERHSHTWGVYAGMKWGDIAS